MTEYRLNYQYNKCHWTTIYYSDNPEDVYKYVQEHEEALIDAIEAPDQCIYIEQYHGKYPVGKWKGDDINKLLLSFQYTAFPWLVDFCEYNM